MIVCTIAAENYLHKAFVLAESLRAHDADVRLAICVPERQIHPAVADSGLFDVALTLGDLAYPNPDQFAFRHGVLELSTAIKPRVMRAALALLPGAARDCEGNAAEMPSRMGLVSRLPVSSSLA